METTDPHLRRARALAKLLDSAITIPGTGITLGLDPILGLLPGGGDVASAAIAGYIVLAAVRAGAPSAVVWRMLANIGVDTLVGTLPVLGDLFDVAYKSNMKNVALLERYSAQPTTVERRSRWMGIVVVIALAALVVAVGIGGFLLGRVVWRLLTGA